jgi:hypothetical protein
MKRRTDLAVISAAAVINASAAVYAGLVGGQAWQRGDLLGFAILAGLAVSASAAVFVAGMLGATVLRSGQL